MDIEKSSIGGWLVPNEYTCNNCGYKGIALEKEWYELNYIIFLINNNKEYIKCIQIIEN